MHTEKGTMFQCLGLGRVDDGGCDEDWWHPECLVGVDREWYKQGKPAQTVEQMHNSNGDQDISTSGIAPANGEVGDINSGTEQADLKTRGEPTLDEEEPPMPPGFPKEDDFEHMICYKCVNAFPWIKRYAGSPGFLNAPRHNNGMPAAAVAEPADVVIESNAICVSHDTQVDREDVSKKRKAEEDEQDEHTSCRSFKKPRAEHDPEETLQQPVSPHCRYATLPTAPSEPVSLFLKPDFREYLCHCPTCFPLLAVHPQLLEEEENYEPPRSSSSAATSHNGDAGGRSNSIGSRSLLDRGEAALSNMDRVRAIEGVMAYNHVRDKVKDFLKPFAESGQAVGAEDIKSYFEKLRGDDRAIKEARNSGSRRGRDDDQEGDARREQRGC